MKTRFLSAGFLLVALLGFAGNSEWEIKDSPLKTRWAKEVSPDNALPEYPRPQMVRKDWKNRNGLWDYAVTPKGQTNPILNLEATWKNVCGRKVPIQLQRRAFAQPQLCSLRGRN